MRFSRPFIFVLPIVLLASPTIPTHTIPLVPAGFTIESIGQVPQARELVATSNGDLFVGTLGSDVDIIPNAEGKPGEPAVFAHLEDNEAAGIALGPGALYVGTTFGVWRIPYVSGDRRSRSAALRIISVRQGGGGGHSTTSVSIAGNRLYVSTGSSCNACSESDPTRATIWQFGLDGKDEGMKASHLRNAIALAIDPTSGDLWAGSAGQDELEHGHPYEIFDDVSAHAGTADYGWPTCYENRRPVQPGIDCSHVTVPVGAFAAYETPIGAAFYPDAIRGRYAFPAPWRGGAFVTLHGSWHKPLVAPRVVFVPVRGRAPAKSVDWNDASSQWREFVSGWQLSDGTRIGRPTGISVGPQGSLFVADGQIGTIYRIRPTTVAHPDVADSRVLQSADRPRR
jgi:glucose/arabinose dehydrogenase